MTNKELQEELHRLREHLRKSLDRQEHFLNLIESLNEKVHTLEVKILELPILQSEVEYLKAHRPMNVNPERDGRYPFSRD